jgi:hypothetical protein
VMNVKSALTGGGGCIRQLNTLPRGRLHLKNRRISRTKLNAFEKENANDEETEDLENLFK